MKKLLTILLCVLSVAVVFANGTQEKAATPANEIQERTIRFSTTSAEGNPVVDAMHLFADLVAEASDGKMKVEIFPSSQLGNNDATKKNCQLGALEMTIGAVGSFASDGAKSLNALSLPFIFRDNEHTIKVLQGEIGRKMLDEVQACGSKCVGIGFWEPGSRNFYSKKPIETINDIKGMKIRCQQLDLDTDMVKALGASPTPIAASEVYSALQTGVVDGADQPISGIVSQKYYEVCKYVTLDGHTAPPVIAVYSEMLWNQLSAKEQEIIQTCWDKATANNLERINNDEAQLIAQLEKEGVTVLQVKDRDNWVKAMDGVFSKYASDCMDTVEAILNLK